MDPVVQKKIDELGQAFEGFKQANDERLKQVEQKGSADANVVSRVEETNKAITALQEEIKSLKTATARSAAGGGSPEDAEAKARKAAVNKYLRRGDDTECKALSVESDPDGGFTVSPETSSDIVKKVFDSSPIRQIASIASISTDSLEILVDVSEPGSSWAGEQGARTATSAGSFKKIVIPTHELYAKPLATQKLLDDAAFNVEAWIADAVKGKFARDEATAFVNGNGIGKPRGFLSYAAGTSWEQIEQVVSGSAATITADGLMSLFYALKGAYRNNATFLMQRLTIAAVRKLKGSDNNYLWAPGLAGGAPDTLLGRPLLEAEDMPVLGANALSVAVGDFKEGYQIVDRVGIRVLRDPYSAKPFIEFYTTKRVGGAVRNFEAIKIGKCSA